MQYSAQTHVIHVNNVAGMPQNLVNTARKNGHNWHFRPLVPARPPLIRAAFQRAVDLPIWFSQRRQADLLHVHYGPNGYLTWGSHTPTVLHLHGSDVRSDLGRFGVGKLTRGAIRRADLVLYSTQDLAERVHELRPDALWLPNAFPEEILSYQPSIPLKNSRVVFATRWDSTKGSDRLAEIAQSLTKAGIECHGIDWGVDVHLARQAGVILHPHMSPADYVAFLSTARIVIGQISFGVPGISELQTMALGLPLVMHFPGAPVLQATGKNVDEAVIDLYHDEERLYLLAQQGREWVLANHHPDQVFSRLTSYYSLLST